MDTGPSSTKSHCGDTSPQIGMSASVLRVEGSRKQVPRIAQGPRKVVIGVDLGAQPAVVFCSPLISVPSAPPSEAGWTWDGCSHGASAPSISTFP